MKESVINRAGFKEYFETFDGLPRARNCFCETPEEMEARVVGEFKHASKKQKRMIRRILSEYRNSHLIDPEDAELLNKILGDRRIIENACVIHDGSHAMFRIWSYMAGDRISLYVDTHFYRDSKGELHREFEDLNPIERLMTCYRKYDMVPFQIHDVDMLLSDELMRESEDYDDYYDDYWDR